VHIATPTTLVSMLRTAQYAWQQQALSENARAVFELGRELHERLAGMGRHVERVGKSLTAAVGAYNQAVSSFESRLLVTARKFPEHGIAGGDPPELPQLERVPVAPAAPELAPVDDVATLPRASADAA